jgi:hypothetical protein
LFLGKPQFAGDYEITGDEFGKFVSDQLTRNAKTPRTLSNDEWEVGSPSDPKSVPDLYFQLAAQVLQSYK